MAANHLAQAGVDMLVVDKGRGVGGRMATRRVTVPDGTAQFDHGAQYFTNYDAQLWPYLQQWVQDEVVERWSTGFYTSDGTPHFNQTPRYIGRTGMASITKHLAQSVPVYTNVTVTRLTWSGRFAATLADGSVVSAESVILTPPVPQALALVDGGALALPRDAREILDDIEYDPCFAVLAVLGSPSRLPPPGGVWPVVQEPIAWLADNQQKGISAVPSVTIHAGPKFSRDQFDTDPETVARLLIEAADDLIGAEVIASQVQRWRYSIPLRMYPARYVLAPQPGPLVLAGDAFAGPRVEGAAMSGLAAAEALLQHLDSA